MLVNAGLRSLRERRLDPRLSLLVIVGFLLILVAVSSAVVLVRLEDPRLLWGLMLGLMALVLSVRHPRSAMLLVVSWLPMMGIVRRLFDTLAFVEFDPLLAVAPGVAAGMVLFAFHRFRASIAHSLKVSRPTLFVTLLTLACLVRTANPFAGGIYASLAPGLFLLGPILWYFLGRAYLDERTVKRMLVATVVIGAVCGLYGIYQAFAGFLPFEEEWIARKVDRFQALHIGRFIRPFSTFPNPEEWSRYMAIAGTVAVGFLASGRRPRLALALVAAISAAAILISGVRTSVFGFLLSVGVVLWLTARSRAVAIGRLAVLAVALAAFLVLTPQLSWREVEASRVAWTAFLGHTARGVRAPLEEDSWLIRLELWADILTRVVPNHPLGMGDADVTESYLMSLFLDTGIPGGVAFLGVLGTLGLHAYRLCRRRRDTVLVIVVGVLAGVALTSLVGNSLALYSIGPLGWALAGWLSAQSVVEQRRSAATIGP